jgi:hypothetical protein
MTSKPTGYASLSSSVYRNSGGPDAPEAMARRIEDDGDRFLFDSATRRTGPEVGMVLTTRVVRTPDGLAPKPCGPDAYRFKLLDDSMVRWKDDIRFEVFEVDHQGRTMTGRFLEKIR